MKYRLILTGNVQQIGLRETIKNRAISMKVKGSVKNLDDGTVEIYCDIPENALETFKNAIKAPNIESIEVYKEGTDGYGIPETDFSRFHVIRNEDEIAETLSIMTMTGIKMNESMQKGFEVLGEKIDSGNKMLGEKIDLGNKMLGEKIDSGNKMLGEKIDSGNKMLGEKIDLGNKMLGEKIDLGNKMLGEKIDSGNKMLGEKIDSMHNDMNVRFDRLDDKYKLISETLTNFILEFKEYNKKLDVHNEKLDKILAILTENKKKKNYVKKTKKSNRNH
ncbi:MAG: acylphosphatase [Candidatus Thermoplasmatota archaeon]|nr:acylphosphatase [Candidatus Thermoplasmatota archaeon]MCL5963881.1 acylphosphatase [Candidatus Thermoplasmatota archaeon]